MKKMKAYIVYGGSGDMLSASLVLENGWAPFGHLCSAPGFMKGDLWGRRTERQEIFKQLGIELEIVGEPIQGSNNAPAGLVALHKDRSNYQEMADEYDRIEKSMNPKKETPQ